MPTRAAVSGPVISGGAAALAAVSVIAQTNRAPASQSHGRESQVFMFAVRIVMLL
jgi:hypothetical protein